MKWCPLMLERLLPLMPGCFFCLLCSNSWKASCFNQARALLVFFPLWPVGLHRNKICIWTRADQFYYVLNGTTYVCWNSTVIPLVWTVQGFLLASFLCCCPLSQMLFASAWCTFQLFTVVLYMKGAAVRHDRLIWALTISNSAWLGRI